MVRCTAVASRRRLVPVAWMWAIVGAVTYCEPAPSAEMAAAGTAEAAPSRVSYHKDVLPLLRAHCHGCHQPAKAGGGFEMTAFSKLLDGGDSDTKAVVPGQPEASNLIVQITPAEGEAAMPQGKPPLADAEIALIRRWIEEGAVDDSPAVTSPTIDPEHPPIYRGPPVITSVDWSPDGSTLAVAGYHEVLLHKADGTGLVGRLVGMSPRIESVRFSPDGTKLAVTGGSPARMGEVQIWDVASRELLLSIPVTFDSVFGASWSPDGKRVAFGCADSSVRAIDVESGEQVLYQSAHDDWVLDTAFSVDGSHLVSVGRDMAAKLIELPTQRFIDNITSITPGALKGGIQSVERHPLRDEILFGGADGTPRIYRMHRVTARVIGDDANLLWEFPSLPGRVFGVDITSDGRVVAAASSLDGHGHVRTFGMEPAPVIAPEVQAILNKPTHQRSDEEVARLKKHYDEGIKALATIEVAEGGIYCVALSPDGGHIAAAGGDGMVRIFDARTGSLVAAFPPIEIDDGAQVAANRQDAPMGDVAVVPGSKVDEASGEAAVPSEAVARLNLEPAAIRLDGPARYAQVIVTAELTSGAKVDVTRQVKWELSAPITTIGADGLVSPTQDGQATLNVSLDAHSATADVQVTGCEQPMHPDFIRDVAPILARAGCNQGTCHGAQAGKNGFKLSLRGYDAVFDVRALADDLASRRVNVASPSESLMLLKSTAAVAHQGGQALKPDANYYHTLRQWIADGAKLDVTSPRVAKLDVMPNNPVVESIGAKQQIRVVATYTDGSQRDVTREAFLESGNTDVVAVVANRAALLESLRRGEAPILVRYEGQYAATTLTVMGDRSGFAWENEPANNRIDELVGAKLQRTKTLPAPTCDDYAFVRRVNLDLTGLPPTPEQIESFISQEGESKAKRDALIDKLVGNDSYVDYWTNKWADLLMVNGKYLGSDGAAALRNWIRAELAANTPYDEFVRKIITAVGSNKENPPASYFKTLRTPEALMENTTHLFLATRFNCNKCHDHPFERWTQDQYYQMAAYFAQVGLAKDPASGDAMIGQTDVEPGKPLYEVIADLPEGEVRHVRTGAVTAPAFPFACEHEAREGATRREQLASWMTSPNNPYFAKSYANRIWGYLTGRGIIEPLDDIRAGNPPTNPELLEFLTREFIDSGFNTRHLVALICKSRTYQRSVATNRWNEDDQINFSHARARRLPAEVLYDAIYQTTGATSVIPGLAPGARAATLPDVGIELPDGFLGNLGRPVRESACECERSSNLQLGPVMALVSGPTVGNAISNPKNSIADLVASIADDSELFRTLYLRVLNRPASAEEIAGARQLIAQLEIDHARLQDELETYSQSIANQIARTELARQARIVEIQTELEVERERAKVREAVAEQERQGRTEAARAARDSHDRQLLEKLPEWESQQKSKTRWRPLHASELGASFRADLAREADGAIFATRGNGKGAYRIAAPIPLERVTGIRLEALADERLPSRGPGRSESGNFVVTELSARVPATGTAGRLVESWDFSSSADGWQIEAPTKVAMVSGSLHLFGSPSRAGIRAAIKQPAGLYALEVVTGVRPAATISVQWSTATEEGFDDTRLQRRWLDASDGATHVTPIEFRSDQEITGLRIVVEDGENVLPLDAIRLYAIDLSTDNKLALQNAQASFSQDAYPAERLIDGDSTGESNGWAISPRAGESHSAAVELKEPLSGAAGQWLEISLAQHYSDGQHTLGKFRISVTDGDPPFDISLPGEIAAIIAKSGDQRSESERIALVAYYRDQDETARKLQAELTRQEAVIPPDAKIGALEARLAQAREPLPVDLKLQQLQRALALSGAQLKNKRLTAAQDVVWAMINSPAFLYNH